MKLKEQEMFLEADEADLVSARIRSAVSLSAKAHLEQRVLSCIGLKTQIRKGEVKPLNDLE